MLTVKGEWQEGMERDRNNFIGMGGNRKKVLWVWVEMEAKLYISLNATTMTAQSSSDLHQMASCAVLWPVTPAAESELRRNRSDHRPTTVAVC